jgi:flagellin-like protein
MLMLMNTLAIEAKAKFGKFLYNEKGEVNIVTTVVLIGIAVALALTFKTGISNLLNSLMSSVSSKATAAVQ